MSTPILLVDDDNEFNRLFHQYFSSNGFRVVVETQGNQATDLIFQLQPALVIIDIAIHGLDGLSVCRKARHFFNGPILILSALNDDIEQVAGLETGADAYLAKPVKPRVLLAHIRALLRRNMSYPNNSSSDQVVSDSVSLTEPQQTKDPVKLERIKISKRSRNAWFDGNLLQLTSGEFDLLWMLTCHAGKIVSRDSLHRYVRGYEYDGIDRTVDQYISKLRTKLGDNAKSAKIIKSVRGAGYILAR